MHWKARHGGYYSKQKDAKRGALNRKKFIRTGKQKHENNRF